MGEGVSLVAVLPVVKMGASMLGPYQPTDTVVTATKAEGRKVLEIDGMPASDWVYAWLGDEVKDAYENGGLILPATAQKPIGILSPEGEYVPAHLAALNQDKSVDFFAPVSTGDTLTVMDSGEGPATGYASTLAAAYDEAVSQGTTTTDDQKFEPKAGLLFYCGGMSIAVGDQLAAGLASSPFNQKMSSIPVLGATVFGEQTSMPKSGNKQRNLSMGMLLFD